MLEIVAGKPKSGRTTMLCHLAKEYSNVLFYTDESVENLAKKLNSSQKGVIKLGFNFQQLEGDIEHHQPDLVIIDYPTDFTQGIYDISVKTQTKIILAYTIFKNQHGN